MECGPLRVTPAGIEISEGLLRHESWQMGPTGERRVRCELAVQAVGALAQELQHINLGSWVKISGFLTVKHERSQLLLLCVQAVELVAKD